MGSDYVRRPLGQISNPRGRLVNLRLLLCATALLLGAGIGHGQWLETKITLPDTLGGALYPTCLTTDTSERYVYIGDRGNLGQAGGVYVVDAETRSRVARIPAVSISAVCTNTRRDKVYAADDVTNRILAISCATNQVVASIPTGANPLTLCYNSSDDKIYAANHDGGDLTVIDCSSDSVVKTIHLGKCPAGLSYNPTSNRVFCLSETLRLGTELTVIDGSNDSVVASYPLDWYGTPVVNAAANKVYLVVSGVGIAVLDGSTGAVLDSLEHGASLMCLNPHTQKLYLGDGTDRQLIVYDCTADTLIAWLHLLRLNDITSMSCDTITDRVYEAGSWLADDRLLVIDGTADTLVTIMIGPKNGRLLAAPKRGRMYCTDNNGPALAVLDTRTDSLLGNVFTGGLPLYMCYDSTDDRVYYASYSFLGEVGAIDAASNRLVAHTQVGPYPHSIVWHSPTNRLYCGGDRDITIIDPTGDSVTKVIPVSGWLLCSAPGVNKVYVSDGVSTLNVIDCGSDSIVRTISLPVNDFTFAMCHVAYDKLYISTLYCVFVVDCRRDSLIRSYHVGYSLVAAGREGNSVICATTDSLLTFDPAADTVVAHVPWEPYSPWAMVYAPGVDKVYCVGGGRILVGDCATDSLIAEIPFELPSAIGYESSSGLVCCSRLFPQDSTITFIDSRTDSIVARLDPDAYQPHTFLPVPAHRRIYVGCDYTSSVPVIRTDPSGVEVTPSAEVPATNASPTVVQDALLLPGATGRKPQAATLLDVSGRKVLDLHPGANDVRALAPGVYFIRAVSGKLSAADCHKVVVTR